jgi:Zn-finger nucleic acid-binding protein
MSCPDCNGGLEPERDDETGEVIAFVCATCRGVWFLRDLLLSPQEDNQ